MSPLVFVLISLAAYRATVLITTDTLSAPVRRALLRRWPSRTVALYDDSGHEVAGTGTLKARWQVELVNCGWCIGFWLAGLAVLVSHGLGLADDWGECLLAWWAAAAVVGMLSELIG